MSSASSAATAGSRRALTPHDYRTLALAALGGALEFYDFVIFVFFAAVIGQLFFPTDMPEWLRLFQTFGIFAAGYLARPFGGIVIAHFGDRLGRKRMFTLTIFLMAVPTLAIGLLPTYAVVGAAAPILLLAMRILQGIAIGGEVPGAWVFVAEHVPAHRFGLAIGTLTAGLTIGILIGSMAATVVNTAFAPADVLAFAWRLPFLLGGAFGLLSVYLRRFLEETPVFQEMSERRTLARELPLKTILRDHRSATLVAILLTWVLSAGIVVVILFTPTYLQQVHQIGAARALRANSLATFALALGCLVFGWANDRFGPRPTMRIGFAALFVSSAVFYTALPGTLVVTYAITGFLVGAVSLVPILAVRSFPAAVRFSGLSFSYNLSYAIFGGLTPVALALWVRSNPMAPAYYVGGIAALGFLLSFAPLADERGR